MLSNLIGNWSSLYPFFQNTYNYNSSNIDEEDEMSHENHFEFSATVKELLFEPIKISSTAGVIVACIVLTIVAISYEAIRLLRKYLIHRSSEDERQKILIRSSDERIPLQNGFAEKSVNCSCDNFTQSFIHMIQMLVGYVLMLSVMTYNAWLLLAVLFGAGLGSFLLDEIWSSKRMAQFEVRVSSNVQPTTTNIQVIAIGHQENHQQPTNS